MIKDDDLLVDIYLNLLLEATSSEKTPVSKVKNLKIDNSLMNSVGKELADNKDFQSKFNSLKNKGTVESMAEKFAEAASDLVDYIFSNKTEFNFSSSSSSSSNSPP